MYFNDEFFNYLLLFQAKGPADVPESELLQMSAPGPLDEEGTEVEDVMNIISQSIYKEGEGRIVIYLTKIPSNFL